MDATKIESFLLLAKSAKGRAAAEIVHKVTSEVGIYAFGELLEVQGIKELEASDPPAYSLLKLFCCGTWTDYKENAGSLPSLNAPQKAKLKQLTVVSMAAASKRLQYSDLMAQLELQNVRELEDLLISECFYPGLVTGKLDQKERCLRVEEAVARDMGPESLQPLISGLASWLQSSHAVLRQLENSTVAVQDAAQAIKQHQADVEADVEAAKKLLKGGEGGSKDADMLDDTGTLDMMEVEDRSVPPTLGGRPKRRR